MTTTISNATLTVTLTEAVTLNGYDQGSSNSFTVADVDEVVKRIVEIPVAETGLLAVGSTIQTDLSKTYVAGMFAEGNVRYIRITNKDDTNHVVITFRCDGNHEFAVKLDTRQSFIFPCDMAGGTAATMDASASALSLTLADLVDVVAIADTAPCDLEVFVASI
tara:strand:- start:35 stop:526 length:492 start_codon:yes stop_codon:yes gene_type:complete